MIAHYFWSLDRPTIQNPLKLIGGLPLGERDEEIATLIRGSGVTTDRGGIRCARSGSPPDPAWRRSRRKMGMGRKRFVKMIQPA